MAAKTANRKSPTSAKQEQDEGPRFAVVTVDGTPVYGSYARKDGGVFYSSPGSTLSDAVRLARSLVNPSGIAQIGEGGRLYRGKVEFNDQDEPTGFSAPDLPGPAVAEDEDN